MILMQCLIQYLDLLPRALPQIWIKLAEIKTTPIIDIVFSKNVSPLLLSDSPYSHSQIKRKLNLL
jgi:hypothetical protein